MKTSKTILSFILAVVMLFSMVSIPVFAEESISLTDIDLSTAEGKAVSRLVSMGIINGYPDGTYRPGEPITRAEFCVVMVKFESMQDYINPEALTGFEDLDTDPNYAWARPYVAMAVQRGIINGFEDGTFRAKDPVTYEQAIKMIVCSLGYGEEAKIPTIMNDWSSGYIAKAMNLKVTSGTSIANKNLPTTRGTVAKLVSNALDAEKAPDFTVGGNDIFVGGNDTLSQMGYTEIKGIVTGTYVTELETGKSLVPKNHIQIDDEYYEIGFSKDPNEFLGCYVEATVKEEGEYGDYPVVTSLKLANKGKVVEVEAGLIGEYTDGILYYSKDEDSEWSEAEMEEDVVIIYNNKPYDYDLADLEEKLVTGSVKLIENSGNRKIDVVKIESYDVFVVESVTRKTQSIKLMYDALYKGEDSMTFPEESTSIIFSLTRNGKDITFTDIAKWDVISVMESPEDADGKRYFEAVVTRETVSGIVNELDSSDSNYIVIGNKEYVISDIFLNYESEEKPEFVVGEGTQVYLDAEGKIVAAAEAKENISDESYAYMLALRQDSDKSDYDLEFWFYTPSGKSLKIGSADKIIIDGKKYKALDEDILDVLKDTAEMANANYPDAENVVYHQPIIYQTNSQGLVSVIHTVNSEENEDISMTMEDPEAKRDDMHYYSAYDADFAEDEDDLGSRQYKSSSKSFTDFKVSSSTKIIFVPDNRADTDEYLNFTSYSKAFANSRRYHVEAFGLTSSDTASLVLIYKQNDARIFTCDSPMLIVSDRSETVDGVVIKGYNGTNYTEQKITVSENCKSTSAIGKGDVIRYFVDGSKHMLNYEIWFDASDPEQNESFSDLDSAIESRILEIHSTSVEPKKNYPTAKFRLQYGTVTELILKDADSDSVDEESITVSPTLVEDDMDMAYHGDGVVSRNIGSSVKVFYFDRSARNGTVETDASLEDILSYEEYGEGATRVITYSASSTLRMVYIIAE